ncbi:hypothetical protein [Dehalogenimonas formicexedens]|uniref:hypothetical protein n=1 Tax=Dehalogenimonas formicexedens TaxID=1839801 RepID=UPI00096BA3F2|nr:hypothetical protein [Dehalogenimonas formicexedens]
MNITARFYVLFGIVDDGSGVWTGIRNGSPSKTNLTIEPKLFFRDSFRKKGFSERRKTNATRRLR